MTAFIPPALPLDSTTRSQLRAHAHSLDPVVMVSSAGLSDAVIAELDRALAHHGLIKVRVMGEDRAERAAILDAMCEKLAAAPVQHIGKILVVYRPPAPKPVEAPKKPRVRKAPAADPAKPKRLPRKKPDAPPKRIMGTAKRSPARARRRRFT